MTTKAKTKKPSPAPCLAVLGTGSDVGKSVIAAALCRIFADRGFRVAPYKAQNMSNNSGVTPEGLEMGRAQIVQAEAAGIAPHVDMNPILLKPTSDVGSQVVLLGEAIGNQTAMDYHQKEDPFGANRQCGPGPPARPIRPGGDGRGRLLRRSQPHGPRHR
jgi:adenosylcobyric acid synthase